MSSEPEDFDLRAFKHQFMDQAARQNPVARNMTRHIQLLTAGANRPGDLEDSVATLVYLLEKGIGEPGLLSDDDVIKFANVVVEALANQGAGSNFGRRDHVYLAIDRAIARLKEAEGGDPTRLLLAKAQFLSHVRNESALRLKTLKLAEKGAKSADLFRVRYRLAWYYIDTSRYRKAIKVCEQTREEAARAGLDKWVCGFSVALGVALYTTLQAPRRARKELASGTALSESLPSDPDVDYFAAEALHYLGRCDLDDGDVEGALVKYVQARRLKESIPFDGRAVAYFHIRMAEALLGAGLRNDADAHLTVAEQRLKAIGDRGAASVSFNYALANLLVYDGDLDAALDLFGSCRKDAVNCGFSRGALLALARTFVVSITAKRFGLAALTAARSVPVLLGGELRRNSLVAIAYRFRRYATAVVRPYEPDAGEHRVLEACPCDLHEPG